MRYAILIVIILHAFIHLIGFVKAFGLAEINQLTQQISKPTGIVWLLAGIMFLVVFGMLLMKNSLWWLPAIIAIIISQWLIFTQWHDARFGTILNVLIFLAAIIQFADWNFNGQVAKEINEILTKVTRQKLAILQVEQIKHLPSPVQKWLISSGAVGKEIIYSVKMQQKALMKLKPAQKQWTKASAEQHFTTEKPAFIWKVNMQMMPLVYVAGRDKYKDGKGEMQIKLLSLFNIVDVKENDKIDQGTLQRYLGEMVWFPSAAINPYIHWEEIDAKTAKATMHYRGVTGSALFYFNRDGEFTKFSAMRYKDSDEKATLKEWIITAQENKIFHGIKIPVKLEATWKLENGDFTWYKLEVTDVQYNFR